MSLSTNPPSLQSDGEARCLLARDPNVLTPDDFDTAADYKNFIACRLVEEWHGDATYEKEVQHEIDQANGNK